VKPEAIAAEVFGFLELRPGPGGRHRGAGRGPRLTGGHAKRRRQVSRVPDHRGDCFPAAVAVNSASRAAAREEAGRLLRSGTPGFIFIAPEQLARDDVRSVLAASPPALVAVE
jgi:hypothetical protein